MYALGCILYEMLTGDVPYRGETPTKTLTMHVFEKIVPPSQRAPDARIPPALEAIVLKVLSKKPNDRYKDMRELMGALEEVEREIRPKRERDSSGAVRTMPRTSSAPIKVGRTPTPPPEGSTSEALAAIEGSGRRRTGLYAAVAAGVLLVAGVGFAVTRKKEPPPAPPVAAVDPTPAPAPAPPPTPAPAAADDVELVLDTKPQGAEVFEGPEHLGTTPLRMRHPKAEASVTYVFRKLGFRDETLPVVPNRDKELMVELVTKDAPPHKVASRKSAPTPTRAAPAPTAKEPSKRVTDLRNPFE
jgi:serine/threonine-protein kinase